MDRTHYSVILLGSVLLSTMVLQTPANAAAGPAQLVASPEAGWPQWRGPRRDGLCDETGLLPEWPAGGPTLLWKTNGLGRGYSAPIFSADRFYLTGDREGELWLQARDLQGQLLWQTRNGRAWETPYPGARASAVLSEGRLYHLNAHGRVACLEASTGREVWAVDILERFGGRSPTWALSENLLVDGPRLIVTPGGSKALMAALDKKNGTTVWSTPPLLLGPSRDPAQERLAEPLGEADSASYCSPILFTLGGRRHLVNCSLRHVFGVDADTGQLLWTRPLPTRYSVIVATPVLVDDAVYVTAPDTEGSGLFRIHPQGRGVMVEKLWSGGLDTCHGGVVYRDGMLYGSWYRKGRGWAAVDVRTGQVGAQLKDLAKGAILYADRRLYCLAEDGEMVLIEPTPSSLEVRGRFRLISERQSDVWTHPVILNGRLYLRYHDVLSCFDIRARSSR